MMCCADLIAGHSVSLQVGGTLVELMPVLEADAVYHQVAVQVVGVDVGGHQYLEVRELTLNQFQGNGVGLLGRQVIRFRKGLDEVIVLPPVRFPVLFLGEPHLGENRLDGAVPASHQPLPFPQCLFVLLCVPQHAAQSAPAPATILYCGESGHLRTPPATDLGAVHRSLHSSLPAPLL